jgi:polyphosphate kinase 2 (PPK2 family)
VFNNSHYEGVLVVHARCEGDVVKRYNTLIIRRAGKQRDTIVKFFLHIDREEQLRRFGDRLDEPEKQWKISDSDYTEREYWDDYQQAYVDAISKCSFNYAPWYIIPANHKWFRNLAVSKILVDTMESWKMKYPEPSVDLTEIKLKYHAELVDKNR